MRASSDTGTITVAPTNAGQVQAWDGDEGAFWAANAERYDRAVAAFHPTFLDAAEIATASRVLDVGCGTGQVTRDAGRIAASGAALGVDLSSRMLEVACALAEAEGVRNARFLHADAQIHPFEAGGFDRVVSRTSAMFFGEPEAAFANLAAALAAGGRVALRTWQPIAGNEWLREIAGALAAGRDLPAPPPGAPGPFALSEPDRVRSLLGGAGFVDVRLDALAGPMYFGTDPDDAFGFIVGQMGWMLQGLDDAERERARKALRATLEAHVTAEGVTFEASTWITTARKR